MIPIASPIIGEEEKEAVLKVLSTGCLAQGQEVEAFEKEFAKFCGSKYAVATSSGTTALEIALRSLNIKNGDEVITTPFSFVASANCILYTGAKPVFCDIERKSFNIDPKKIEDLITNKTKAIIPVHLYGLPANMNEIVKIARKYNLKVIEDACQAHGAEINNQKTGTFGDAACFSFYPTKNMTTGEGGIALFKDRAAYEKALVLRAHGMKVKYHHEILGYNYRMTDIHASIGREQLKKLGNFNKKRQENARYLLNNIKNPKVELPEIINGYTHVFHQFTIMTDDRKKTLEHLHKNGIGSGVHYPICINEQPLYKKLGYKNNTPISKKISEKVVSIPVHPALTDKNLEDIVKAINSL
jgi:perosamine synthetase